MVAIHKTIQGQTYCCLLISNHKKDNQLDMEPNVRLSGNRQDADLSKLENRECLNFISINSDCMQLIFEHLEFNDLVNVVETCKSFNEAACAVFRRRYSGRRRMALEFFNKKRVSFNLVNVSRLVSLKVLRNFGHTIRILHINQADHLWDYNQLLYVNEYCSESVEELLFFRCSLRVLEMKKLFTNVRSLKMMECDILDQTTTFTSEFFPNLKRLKLKENFYHTPSIVQHMPKISRFSLTPRLDALLTNKTLSYDNEIIALLKTNPQVEVLQLHLFSIHEHRILQCISKDLPSLRKLTLTVHDEHVLQNGQELLQFNNVEDFHLLTVRLKKISRNPFVFKKLKSFTATNWIFDEKCMIDFIDKNNGISSFDIHFESIRLEDVNAKRILYNVEEFRLEDLLVPIERILEILKQNSRLKKFFIRGTIRESYQVIFNTIRSSGFAFKEEIKWTGIDTSIKNLELFANNSLNSSVKQSVLEVPDRSSPPFSIIWYSDRSAVSRRKKYIEGLL